MKLPNKRQVLHVRYMQLYKATNKKKNQNKTNETYAAWFGAMGSHCEMDLGAEKDLSAEMW